MKMLYKRNMNCKYGEFNNTLFIKIGSKINLRILMRNHVKLNSLPMENSKQKVNYVTTFHPRFLTK